MTGNDFKLCIFLMYNKCLKYRIQTFCPISLKKLSSLSSISRIHTLAAVHQHLPWIYGTFSTKHCKTKTELTTTLNHCAVAFKKLMALLFQTFSFFGVFFLFRFWVFKKTTGYAQLWYCSVECRTTDKYQKYKVWSYHDFCHDTDNCSIIEYLQGTAYSFAL